MREIRLLSKEMCVGGQVFGELMDDSRSFPTNGLKCGESRWFDPPEDVHLDQMFWPVPVGALNYVSSRAGQVPMVT
jgi:hypothetical protein